MWGLNFIKGLLYLITLTDDFSFIEVKNLENLETYWDSGIWSSGLDDVLCKDF